MPPIATENGEALNARGETARYTSEGIVLCRQRAVALFERLPKRFLCLGFFFAKWSKLLRLPFPTSASLVDPAERQPHPPDTPAARPEASKLRHIKGPQARVDCLGSFS